MLGALYSAFKNFTSNVICNVFTIAHFATKNTEMCFCPCNVLIWQSAETMQGRAYNSVLYYCSILIQKEDKIVQYLQNITVLEKRHFVPDNASMQSNVNAIKICVR